MSVAPRLLAFAGALMAGCVSLPSGPSVMVLPGTGKSFDQFRVDDRLCRDFAFGQIGGTVPGNNANDAMARSAVVGTAVGALAGAAIDGSQGAGVGAGVGLLGGTVAGASAADMSAYGAQRRYDHAFIQCMYAQGHRVPVSGQFTASPPGPPPPPPPPSPATPPPPR